jgi:hypothetical protein
MLRQNFKNPIRIREMAASLCDFRDDHRSKAKNRRV